MPLNKVYFPHKIRKLVQFVQQLNEDVAPLLSSTALTVQDLQDDHLRIGKEDLIQVYKNAVQMAQGRPWGIEVGSRLGLTDYGFYGYALICSATLRSALDFAIKYHPLAAPTVLMIFNSDNQHGCAELRLEDTLFEPDIYHFNIEMQVGLVCSLFRDIIGREFNFSQVLLRTPLSDYSSRMEGIVNCPIHFEQDKNAVIFPIEVLDKPLRRANLFTLKSTREICDQLLNEMSHNMPVSQLTYDAIANKPGCSVGADEIAVQLGLSERSLRRRLSEEGTSVREIKRKIKTSIASEYLMRTDMTGEEIAERLGFCDAASFRAAIKTWTGQSLSEFRAGLKTRN